MGCSTMLQTQMSLHLAKIARYYPYIGPEGCQNCAGLQAGPRISVCACPTYTEPGPCQGMRWMTSSQGGAAALGLRPHIEGCPHLEITL